jgi:hypothetical protein
MEIGGLEFGHFPAPEEPDVCSAPLERRAGSSGAECLSASSEIVGARCSLIDLKHTPPLEAGK